MVFRGLFASFGASSIFSAVAFEEWLKAPSIGSALAFAGSAASALISYELAKRIEAHREDLDAKREKRHIERLQKLAELAQTSHLSVQELQALDDLDGPDGRKP